MSDNQKRNPLFDRFVPYYYQIASLLREKIEGGEFAPGARLPGEIELAKNFGVSRVPVRRALSLLENEGMLSRHRGRGTFVLEKEFVPKAPILSGVIEDYVTTGLQGTLGLLSMERVPAPPKALEFFEIPEGEILMLIRRLRKVEGMPYSYVMNYLPIATAAEIPIADLKIRTMVSILEERMGISFQVIQQTIEAKSADSEIAAQLSVETTSPVMYVETFVRSEEGNPIQFSRTFYRGDRYKYMIELTRKK